MLCRELVLEATEHFDMMWIDVFTLQVRNGHSDFPQVT